MFSRSSSQILLRDNRILAAKCRLPTGDSVDSLLDLDHCLGNQDGRLIVGGQKFSLAARNARLDGNNLNAMLKKIDGSYVHDTVNLDAFIGNDFGVLTVQRSYDESQLRAERSVERSVDVFDATALCSVCKNFPNLRTPDINVTFEDLADRSRVSSCPTCSILADAMKNFAPEGALNLHARCSGRKPQSVEELVSLEFEYDTMNPISVKYVLFTPNVVDKSNEGTSAANRLTSAEYPESGIVTTSENFRDVPSAKLIIGDSTSGESLKLGSKWLDQCSQSHEICNLNENMPLPSRILDLKGPEGSPIKLHITKCESAKYACLSHCWGNSKSLVLTCDNLNELTQRILTNDLPKTYMDAIDFCRGLGIRYLWIDALCIIQTDQEDWSSEAGRMSTYYGGCYVVSQQHSPTIPTVDVVSPPPNWSTKGKE